MKKYTLKEFIDYLVDSHFIFNLSFENIFDHFYDFRLIVSDINCGLSSFEEFEIISDLKYEVISNFGKTYWSISFRFNGGD